MWLLGKLVHFSLFVHDHHYTEICLPHSLIYILTCSCQSKGSRNTTLPSSQLSASSTRTPAGFSISWSSGNIGVNQVNIFIWGGVWPFLLGNNHITGTGVVFIIVDSSRMEYQICRDAWVFLKLMFLCMSSAVMLNWKDENYSEMQTFIHRHPVIRWQTCLYQIVMGTQYSLGNSFENCTSVLFTFTPPVEAWGSYQAM